MAVQEAQIWCDKLENKEEMAQIVSESQWLNTSAKNRNEPKATSTSATVAWRRTAVHYEVLVK